ncbi:MAG: DUF1566 domain-containing protein [Anaerolineaceae bacterium]|nr:DUF1566 domain-containing protein [Anaerolineaceae bacterium]
MKKKLLVISIIFMLISACSSFNSIWPLGNTSDESESVSKIKEEIVENMETPEISDPIPLHKDVKDVPVEDNTSSSDETLIQLTYPIVDTNQIFCYGDSQSVNCPQENDAYFGQDAQYSGLQAAYVDNGDGTVTDLNTGLMWQQDPGDKMTYDQAVSGADSFELAGYDDWRLPSIKELYSLIQFSGQDPSGCQTVEDCPDIVPFIDSDYFNFEYGDTSQGQRVIDSQWASSNVYTASPANSRMVFGVNFADGRIKGYGLNGPTGNGEKTFFVIYVRGNTQYGLNEFRDNQDGTITDIATGLTWMQADSSESMNWEAALDYCENLDYAGNSDWRLPNVKELHSIVDYSRAPETTNSAAIDALFDVTEIINEAGETDYGYYWSSTTHANIKGFGGGAYIAFGTAPGYMREQWVDVHGAGAQRSDPKSGDPDQYPTGHGPQGDAIRINNLARCVSSDTAQIMESGVVESEQSSQPQPLAEQTQLSPQGPASEAPGNQPGQGAPQEALDACQNLSENDNCSFNSPRGTVEGVCLLVQNDALACVPEDAPRP